MNGWWRRPRKPAGVPVQVIVYSRAGCHLCDDAADLLADEAKRFPLHIEKIDIDTDAVLKERYGLLIPVIVIDGVERFRGRVNSVLLRRLLDGIMSKQRGPME